MHTSLDGYVWDEDATYLYYAHGPLARVELGHYKVQGLDYYYNLQGWLKGVNHPGMEVDPGRDGMSGTHSRVSKDAFAFSLHHFEGDYKPSNPTMAANFGWNNPGRLESLYNSKCHWEFSGG